MKVKRKLSVFV